MPLNCSGFGGETVILTDFTDFWLEATLARRDGHGVITALATRSRDLSSHERNFSGEEKELAGVAFACETWKGSLAGIVVTVITNRVELACLNKVGVNWIDNPELRDKLRDFEFIWELEN